MGMLVRLGQYNGHIFRILNPLVVSPKCHFVRLHNKNTCSTRPLFRRLCTSIPEKHLVINPISCLHDEPVQIEARGLSPGDDVTLTSVIKDTRGQVFFTYTHYKTGTSGIINLATDGSLGGSYKGVFPMGPIACLLPGPNEHKYLRFLKKNVNEPMVVNFSLLRGHVDDQACSPDPHLILDSSVHERAYMAPGTERIPVCIGKIRGTLFLPAGEGPFPGVIDLFGTAGGLLEFRAAQLASRGIASLALAYFDYEDLPKDLQLLDIGYFEEAVSFLLSNSKVKKCGVGAIGVSKGADLACSMATFIPEVKVAVCINGLPVNTWCPLKAKEKTYPGLYFDISRGKILSPELLSTMDMMRDSLGYPETYLPLHEADAEFLFLVGLEDKNWKTNLETTRAVERMKSQGNTNFKVLRYSGTGHLLEPPYSPHSYATYHKMAGVALVWGGSPKEHCEAQVNAWNEMITFIKNALN